MMDLHHLSDDDRRGLAVVGVAGLMVVAAVSAGLLGAVGRETGAGAALAVSLACSLPVLAGTVLITDSTGRRLVRGGLTVLVVVSLLALMVPEAGIPGV